MENGYLEVITIKGWVDDNGWSYETVYNTQLVKQIPDTLEVRDIWIADEKKEGGDVRITVTYYAEDDEDRDNPIKEFNFWESEFFDNE